MSPTPEIPCPVSLDRIMRGQAAGRVTATPAQLQALARRLKVPSVTAFRFAYGFQPTTWPNVYRLEGTLSADLQQECVVTLEPLPQRIEAPFSCLCGIPQALAALEATEQLDPAEDPPEEITADGVDVGELAVQYLSLALADYPRRGDVSLPDLLSQMGHPQHDNAASASDRQQPFRDLSTLLKTPKG